MDINDLRTLFTLFAVTLFAGIVIWAYSAKRKVSFDEAARLALDDEEPSAGDGHAGQMHN